MIIIKLKGGLGNQLFQYAIGRQISFSLGVKLKVDIVDLLDRAPRENFTFRDFELDKFNCKFQVANKNELLLFKSIHIFFTKCNFTQSYWIENNFSYNKNILECAEKSMYLDGYWQSEKYFNSIRSILLQDLKINIDFEMNLKFWEIKILNSTSVSVHVRRGDYLTNFVSNKFHGVCSIDYYYKCMDILKSKVLDCNFYFFSDDINWAKATFSHLENVEFVISTNNIEDLHLMSLCKHNIIANSSFSWWGAWLNNNKEKIVLAPKIWFNDSILNMQTQNLIPSEWLRI